MSDKMSFMRQTSDDWQDGVRLENRLRNLERDVRDVERRVWWLVVYVSVVLLLVIATFAHH